MLIHEVTTIKPQLPQAPIQARIAVLKQKVDHTQVAVKGERKRSRYSKFMPISTFGRPIQGVINNGLRSVGKMRQIQASSIPFTPRPPNFSLHIYA